jgi:hypothetical protein
MDELRRCSDKLARIARDLGRLRDCMGESPKTTPASLFLEHVVEDLYSIRWKVSHHVSNHLEVDIDHHTT